MGDLALALLILACLSCGALIGLTLFLAAAAHLIERGASSVLTVTGTQLLSAQASREAALAEQAAQDELQGAGDALDAFRAGPATPRGQVSALAEPPISQPLDFAVELGEIRPRPVSPLKAENRRRRCAFCDAVRRTLGL